MGCPPVIPNANTMRVWRRIHHTLLTAEEMIRKGFRASAEAHTRYAETEMAILRIDALRWRGA